MIQIVKIDVSFIRGIMSNLLIYKILILMAFLFISSYMLNCAENNDFINYLGNKTYFEKMNILEDTLKNSNDNQILRTTSKLYLELVNSENDNKRLANAYLQTGRALWLRSDNPNAMKFLFKAIKKGKAVKDTSVVIEANIYIGIIYNSYLDWDNSKKYFSEVQ